MAGSDMSIESVQRWVLSSLAVVTIEHFAFGLLVAAYFIDDSHRDSQIGLCVMAGIVGMVAVAAGFAIHRRSVLTPWLLAGWLPSTVAVWVILR